VLVQLPPIARARSEYMLRFDKRDEKKKKGTVLYIKNVNMGSRPP
jgi:hypothetical protein